MTTGTHCPWWQHLRPSASRLLSDSPSPAVMSQNMSHCSGVTHCQRVLHLPATSSITALASSIACYAFSAREFLLNAGSAGFMLRSKALKPRVKGPCLTPRKRPARCGASPRFHRAPRLTAYKAPVHGAAESGSWRGGRTKPRAGASPAVARQHPASRPGGPRRSRSGGKGSRSSAGPPRPPLRLRAARSQPSAGCSAGSAPLHGRTNASPPAPQSRGSSAQPNLPPSRRSPPGARRARRRVRPPLLLPHSALRAIPFLSWAAKAPAGQRVRQKNRFMTESLRNTKY